jgi:diguanylate cyclase (GGDEF)-like protein/PAS domain S-box-containing protein
MGESLSQPQNAELRGQWEQTFVSTTRGITIVDPATGIIESTNPAFAAMHGGTVEDFIGTPAVNALSPEGKTQLGAVLETLDRDGHITMVSEHARLDGSTFEVAFEAITTRSVAGDALYRIAWYEDLTERRAAEDARREAHEMFEAAFADAPNSVALIGLDSCFLRVNSALCEMFGRSLLLVDLDGFKQVNDNHGHRAGDELLKRVARALRTRLRRTDSLARLGGDEFGIILANVTPDRAMELAAALREVVSAAGIDVDDTQVRVTASVGVAPLDEHTASDEEALEQADTAMYRDKAARGHGRARRLTPHGGR